MSKKHDKFRGFLYSGKLTASDKVIIANFLNDNNYYKHITLEKGNVKRIEKTADFLEEFLNYTKKYNNEI